MTRIPYLLVLLLALGVTSARVCHARDTARPVGPIHSWTAADLDRFDGQWLHVKFVEGSNVRLESGRLEDDRLDLSPVRAALARASALEIRPTFTWDRATVRAWKAAGEAKSGAVGPDLSLWFDVRIAAGKAELARAINELNALPQVEIAHPAPIVEPAALPAASATVAPAGLATRANAPRDLRTPDFTGQQGYLYAPPTGFDAAAAWALPGGKGAGQKFIDVELAWTEQHEDFDQAKLFHVGGAGQSTNPAYIDHGTAVLGEVIGMHNAYGVNGFAADTEWGVVAVLESEWPNVPHRFQEALDNLPEGGVWLIELQMYPPGHSATPMEYLQVNYDVIWTSVWARGVVCVEAGANGSQNLDDASWGGLFDRNVRDSGAIMVGAGTPNGLDAEWFTNYGTRMDVQGWGSSIVSTGYGDLYSGGGYETEYTAAFSGTSGASPMVVGSTLCLQGIF
ncbi:MAG: hypothetical protein QUU85_01755, partial [Candidatus Eisenbacteria bacterium]|nr:hypothetical protein [Candidatus Eisenbacteria bacterium]